jgi:signal transduction histidine kinase
LKTAKPEDDRAKRMLEMLSADVSRANKIVTDLLDFSRAKKLNKADISLPEFIDNILQHVPLPENIQVVKDVEVTHAAIDPDKMTQALINLVSNAKDAMPAGGRLDIIVRKDEAAVSFVFRDNGCGMDRDISDHIFEPLFSTKIKGMGLGLAIVKEIIDLHFGKITVTSEKGKGTTFEISVPV